MNKLQKYILLTTGSKLGATLPRRGPKYLVAPNVVTGAAFTRKDVSQIGRLHQCEMPSVWFFGSGLVWISIYPENALFRTTQEDQPSRIRKVVCWVC
jgi:hypothetical protein